MKLHILNYIDSKSECSALVKGSKLYIDTLVYTLLYGGLIILKVTPPYQTPTLIIFAL